VQNERGGAGAGYIFISVPLYYTHSSNVQSSFYHSIVDDVVDIFRSYIDLYYMYLLLDPSNSYFGICHGLEYLIFLAENNL